MSSFGSSVINKSNKKVAPKSRNQRRRPNSETPVAVQRTPEPTTEADRPSHITTRNSERPYGVAEARPKSTIALLNEVEHQDAARPDKRRRTVSNTTCETPVDQGEGQDRSAFRSLRTRYRSYASEVPQRLVVEADNDVSRQVEFDAATPGQQLEVESGSSRSNKKTRKTQAASMIQRSVDAQDIEPTRGPLDENGSQRRSGRSSRASNPQRLSDSTQHTSLETNRELWRNQQRIRTEPAAESYVGQSDHVGQDNETALETTEEYRNTSQELRDSGNDLEDQSIVPPKKRRKRKVTPDGAEDHEINPGTITMYELCKDSRKGKKSRLESEFQEVDWTEVVRRRKEAEARARAGETDLETRANDASMQPDRAQEIVPQGPRLKLVNGQIVVDTSSLVIDRHAAAKPHDAQPAVEERDITRRVNSQSWMNDNRRDPRDRYRLSNKSDPWSASATEQFYSALRMFGTDFMMISKMFPGRTRRHIKLKFVREERAKPAKIKEALVGGSVPMDLQTYCHATGQRTEDYKDPLALEEELKAEEERQRTEIEKQKEEQAEAQRRKQEAAAAKAATGKQRKIGEKGSGKNRKKKQGQTAPGATTTTQIDRVAVDAVVDTIGLE